MWLDIEPTEERINYAFLLAIEYQVVYQQLTFSFDLLDVVLEAIETVLKRMVIIV